jgi:parallel beta-helix repeat protein
MRRLAVTGLVAAALVATGCATAQTGGPSATEDDAIFFTGSVVSDAGGPVEYWVQYGLTKAYGSESAHQTITVAKNTPTGVNASFEGLTRSTLYHYRLCARDDSQQGGPGCGEDHTARTQSFDCGETVTTDVRFTGNSFCTQAPVGDPGLVIGAPGIEIDMRGFQLIGPIFVGAGGAAAIDNSGGFDDVTIRDGQLGNFGDGIHLEDASRNRILHMQSNGPSDGVEIHGGSGNEIRHSNLFGRSAGLRAIDTTGLIVADSAANGAFGSAMVFNGLVGSRLVRNEVVTGGNCCTTSGIALTASSGNVIQDNRVGGWNGANIVLASGSANKLLGNQVFDGFIPPNSPTTFDAEGDGIFVGAFTANTIVRGNHAHDNDGDGIEVQGIGTRITDNTADSNGDFGIDAVAGVTDGGGNTAGGNGNPLQCRNVFCL